MIKEITSFINESLLPLNYYSKQYEYCELIIKSDGNKRPAQYKGKGEYEDVSKFDSFNGVSYMRKNGKVGISDAENSLTACQDFVNMTYTLKLVSVIPRKKLECDDKFAEEEIAQEHIIKIISRSTDLKVKLSARQARISVESYNTDGWEIIKEEYDEPNKQDINFKFIYISFDILVTLLINKECIGKICEPSYY